MTTRKYPSQNLLMGKWLIREIISWLKEPAATLLNIAYPLLMMAFLFVTGGEEVRANEEIASKSVALLGLIGVLMVGINLPANGINEIRGSDYYYYLRTLPVGMRVRLITWSGAPLILAFVSAIIALIVGVLVSAASYSFTELLLLCLLYFCFGLCTTAWGVFLGFILSKKSSLAVSLGASFLLLMLSGGRVMADLPTALDVIARMLPSTPAVDLCQAIMDNSDIKWQWIILLVGWLIAGLIAATVALKADEQRRFA